LGEGIDVKSTIEQHFNNTYGGGEQWNYTQKNN
jgi:hypothetical protein